MIVRMIFVTQPSVAMRPVNSISSSMSSCDMNSLRYATRRPTPPASRWFLHPASRIPTSALGRRREPERAPIADADLLPLGNRAKRHQRHRLLRFVADDLRVRLLRMVAERYDAKNDARAVLPIAEAEVVVPEPRLRDAPRVGIVIHDHRAGYDRRTDGNLLRRHETAAFALELADGVH